MLHMTRLFVLRIGVGFLAAWLAVAASGAWADARPRFDSSALDAMIAPIALYPDHLLTQVLMAATYPEEVREAARWSRERPGLSGDAAVRTAEGFDWDPSVRSLTAFPHVLDTMSQHMAWTEDLGQAFIVQPQDVMDTVQRLRFRAYEAGTLVSNDHTRVIHTGSSLIIETVRPQVVHVPYYDSQVAYGPWLWPARPPMVWPRWHGYYEPYATPSIVHWGPGIWLGSGFFFGGFDWPRREVRVINTRPYYYHAYRNHRPAHLHATPHVWRHDGERRSAWRQRAQPVESSRVPAQRTPQATGALAPQGVQPPQAEGNDPRFDRRARRGRDSDGDGRPDARGSAGVNPTAPQAAERPVQRSPHARQDVPAAGAPLPRNAQPQIDGSERSDRRVVRRSRDSDVEVDTRTSAPVRSSVSPAPAQMRSAPQEAPRANIEERRSRALSRNRD